MDREFMLQKRCCRSVLDAPSANDLQRAAGCVPAVQKETRIDTIEALSNLDTVRAAP